MGIQQLAVGPVGIMRAAAVSAAVGGVAAVGATTYATHGRGIGALSLGLFFVPTLLGGVSGMAAAALLARSGASALRYLTIPAGVGGGLAGAAATSAAMTEMHEPEWADIVDAAERDMADTRRMFAAAGAPAEAITEVPLTFEPRSFNASYHLPTPSGDGHHITFGRSLASGLPLTGDIIAHEFAHRAVHALAPGLGYRGAAGALHESLADTFAAAVDGDDWLLGEVSTPPDGVRSLEDPGRPGRHGRQPTTRSEAERGGRDAHRIAGVGNKAAWRVGNALGRDVMARIYVAALDDPRLDEDATFADLAGATRSAAADLYGSESRQFDVVDSAWNQAEYPAQ
ncbi:MAG: putative zinc metalloprotease [Thermoleophilia bacterium]|jgi:hypothetical protein|nr:putative zinc metalloprotease [Thermoleophilia bacterium]